MSRRGLLLFLLLPATGCEFLKSAKVDSPVFGPPPPRVSWNADSGNDGIYVTDAAQVFDAQDSNRLQMASLTSEGGAADERAGELSAGEVVAIVNGEPLFATEVLERFTPKLVVAREKLLPAQYAIYREGLLREELPNQIERKLLVQALRLTLEKEQLEQLDAAVDSVFGMEIERLQKAFNVGSRRELEIALEQQNLTLEGVKQAFITQQMAVEYLRSKTEGKKQLGRSDLLAWYREHRDEFEIPAQVRWQQLVLYDRKQGGRDAAEQKLEQVVAEARQGDEFTELVKRYSDGPTAQSGGFWDWTHKNSLKNEQIERALFELPVGTVSQPFLTRSGIEVVKVVDRREQQFRPFEELQDEIKQRLEREERDAATEKVIGDLKEQADIVTIFDAEASDDHLPLRIR